ncbi:MAG: SCP2 sterol-binding domain-containing protein [Kangiellaceae bacterium]|nr:SCP2 sterol-binding domain-containing protein [Kangiellaceae bacterium]
MLTELFSPTIETVINQVIKLDTNSINGKTSGLSKLDKKVIKFQLTDIKQQLFFIIDEDYIVVKADTDKEVHAELIGSTFSFFNLAVNDDSNPLFKGEVRFSGEISTAQNFQKFFENLDIDWEEHLSQYTGDIVAHQLFKTGKSFHHWAMATLNTAQQNFSEHLRFESRTVPASIELENFYDNVADLKSDVDRLSQKVERLMRHKAEAHNN